MLRVVSAGVDRMGVGGGAVRRVVGAAGLAEGLGVAEAMEDDGLEGAAMSFAGIANGGRLRGIPGRACGGGDICGCCVGLLIGVALWLLAGRGLEEGAGGGEGEPTFFFFGVNFFFGMGVTTGAGAETIVLTAAAGATGAAGCGCGDEVRLTEAAAIC